MYTLKHILWQKGVFAWEWGKSKYLANPLWRWV